MSGSELPHRVGVLDVGCFSAHLVVVELDRGSLLHPVISHKVRLRLDQTLDSAGRISPDGMARIAAAVGQARRLARDTEVATLVPFATSVIRDAANAAEVIQTVTDRSGLELCTLTGQQEARLSYHAARHWFGWAAGPLTVLDVGGGTVELTVGDGGEPEFAHSLVLGARTLTRLWAGRAPAGDRLSAVGSELTATIRAALPAGALSAGTGRRAVACSKVFQQLARLTGARAQREGPFAVRHLRAADLRRWIPRLAALPATQRAKLPGISEHRAHQSLAGAIIADALMRATGHEVVELCPWSTREGLLLTLQERGTAVLTAA